jgi:tRNA threonylcarbamoyladenosine biosynthesis protein TsaB
LALLLNIETTTTNCSEILALKEDYNTQYSHAESLHVFIDELFKTANILPNNIDAVAVSKGPGSYTGLRIGVSAAKGLCYALDKPLIAVSTLEALSHQINTIEGKIVTMLDARRMEVYSAVFDSKYHQIREIKAEVLNENSFSEYLQEGNVYFIGSGVDKAKTIITHPNAIFIENKLPSANYMGKLAYKNFIAKLFEDVAYFEPYYLKDFILNKGA